MYWLNKISKLIASVFLNFLYNMVTSIFKTAYVAYATFVLDSTALDTIHSLWEILFLPIFHTVFLQSVRMASIFIYASLWRTYTREM